MNIHDDSKAWAPERFAVGQPVPRMEDPTLVQGQGRYTDDVTLPNMAYAVIVRSRNAHGKIKKLDVSAAKKMPGVLAVYTGADIVAAGYGVLKTVMPLKQRDGSIMQIPVRHALAEDKVRFVGDPVACVIAETVNQGKDVAEAVVLDIEPLPAVTDPEEAVKPGAPTLYEQSPGNVVLDYHYGDAEATAAAFAKAAHVARVTLVNSRVVVNAMEPRAALASYDKGRFTFYVPSQGVYGMRANVAQALGVETKQVRVISGHIGGSFGMKAALYPEYICILHAARALGRPVKWTDERSTSFVSDSHGRDHKVRGELALDAEGNFLAVRLTSFGNMGGFLANVGPLASTFNAVKNVQNV
ncbi:MAG: xanthine dehydrogenase family protein molybdopterin-binding subunit, partial [Xanthobacteraceae bacterium]